MAHLFFQLTVFVLTNFLTAFLDHAAHTMRPPEKVETYSYTARELMSTGISGIFGK